MKKILKKYKLWFGIVGFFLVLGLIFVFAVKPLINLIQEKSDNIQRKVIDSEVIKKRIEKIPEMKANQELFRGEGGSLNVIMGASNEVDFIKRLEALAEETGNKIELKIDEAELAKKSASVAAPAATNEAESAATSSAPKKVVKKDPEDIKANLPSENYLTIQIMLQGGYGNFVNFLRRLENLDFYVNVIALNVTKVEKSGFEQNQSPNENIFFSADSAPTTTNSDVVSQDEQVKEILKSTIDAVVYISK
jgi:F0F1-type ATP synthase membrane subunit b/b'